MTLSPIMRGIRCTLVHVFCQILDERKASLRLGRNLPRPAATMHVWLRSCASSAVATPPPLAMAANRLVVWEAQPPLQEHCLSPSHGPGGPSSASFPMPPAPFRGWGGAWSSSAGGKVAVDAMLLYPVRCCKSLLRTSTPSTSKYRLVRVVIISF